MQIATPTSAAPAIVPGLRIAAGTDRTTGAPVDVVAGRVLRTGVRDIDATGWELIRSTHDLPRMEAWGSVAFLRAGDAWTAVELLAKTTAGTEALWLTSYVQDVRVADDVTIDAVWQVSHYGGDYTDSARKEGWITPGA